MMKVNWETEGAERGLDRPAFSLGQGGGALPKKGTELEIGKISE